MASTGDFGAMLREAHRRAAGGERVALVTIVQTRGSTPRKVGCKMLVFEDGLFTGTVGGGCGEADVLEATMEAMQRGEPTLFHVDLTADEAEESGDVCGGIMDVFIEPMLPRRAPVAVSASVGANSSSFPSKSPRATAEPASGARRSPASL